MKALLFIVTAGLYSISRGLAYKADNYYGGKLQDYLSKIAEIYKKRVIKTQPIHNITGA